MNQSNLVSLKISSLPGRHRATSLLLLLLSVIFAESIAAEPAVQNPEVSSATANHKLTLEKCNWLAKALKSVVEMTYDSKQFDDENSLFKNAARYVEQYEKTLDIGKWTSADEKHSFEGFYLGHDQSKVILKSKGNKELSVPLTKLSEHSLRRLAGITTQQTKVHLSTVIVFFVTSDPECRQNVPNSPPNIPEIDLALVKDERLKIIYGPEQRARRSMFSQLDQSEKDLLTIAATRDWLISPEYQTTKELTTALRALIVKAPESIQDDYIRAFATWRSLASLYSHGQLTKDHQLLLSGKEGDIDTLMRMGYDKSFVLVISRRRSILHRNGSLCMDKNSDSNE